MLDSYFFIPGDRQKFLDKIASIPADYLVIDLEDAVSSANKQDAFDRVMTLNIATNYFVRIPFQDACYNDGQLKQLIQHFQGRIVLPKVQSLDDVSSVVKRVPDMELRMIVLVENPLCILNLTDILRSHASSIHAISFGSHDFCAEMGIKHTLENLIQYKRDLVLKSKAFGVDYVDGVDINLKDYTQFRTECKAAFDFGAEGKFLIHPNQLDEMHKLQYLAEDEKNEIIWVYDQIKDIADNDIGIYTFGNKVYEKPHIKHVKQLMRGIIKTEKHQQKG